MKVADSPIPVPPFSGGAEARLFVQQLALHLAALDRDAVSLSTFTLVTVLEGLHGRAHRRDDSSDIDLPFAVLQAALITGFPAPWNPQGVRTALDAGSRWAITPPTIATTLTWGSDPRFTAIRDRAGLWSLDRTERGTTDREWSGRSDAEFVQTLLDGERQHAFPYGWASDDLPGHDEIVRAAVSRRDRWDAGPGRLPYLTNWIAERDIASREQG